MELPISWEANSRLRYPQHLMETEASVQYSQEPVTCHHLKPDESIQHPRPSSLKSILILSSLLRLGLPTSLFFSEYPTHTLYALLLFHARYVPCHDLLVLIIFFPFFPVSCYFVPLRCKWSQHPVLKHPQFVSFPHYVTASFKPVQNCRQNYSFIWASVFVFCDNSRVETERT
jgi:hypothetical protein